MGCSGSGEDAYQAYQALEQRITALESLVSTLLNQLATTQSELARLASFGPQSDVAQAARRGAAGFRPEQQHGQT